MPKLNEIKTAKEIDKKGSHRYIWHVCVDCGKERWVSLTKGLPRNSLCRFCRPTRKGEYNSNWKGGRRADGHGYIRVYVYDENPFSKMANDGCILEHRLVVAQHLGRCLESWEIVHHLNGIRDDNRIENLELLPNKANHQCFTILQKYVKNLESKIVELQQQVEELLCQLKNK